MQAVWIEYVPWVYATIQGIVTIFVSIMGTKYVRHEFVSQKNKVQQQTELTINIERNTQKSSESSENVNVQIEKQDTETSSKWQWRNLEEESNEQTGSDHFALYDEGKTSATLQTKPT